MRNRYLEDRRRFESARDQHPPYQGYGSSDMDRGDDAQRWGQDQQSRWGRDDRGSMSDRDRGEWNSSGQEWRPNGDDRSAGDRGYGRDDDRSYVRPYGSPYGYGTSDQDERGRNWSSGRSGSAQRGQSNGFGSDLRGPSGMYQGSGTFGSHEGYARGDRGWAGGRGMGDHAGKGPKGYTRSDDRIKEDISDRLMADGEIDASEIEIDVVNGEVTLRGAVDSRDAKRSAEDCVEIIQGVKNVQNQLRVQNGSTRHAGGATDLRSPSDRSSSSTGASGTGDASTRNRMTETGSKTR